MASKVRDVHVIGRRGPAQAKFTTKELRELGELGGVDILVDPAEVDSAVSDPAGLSALAAETDRRVRGNLTVIRGWADRAPAGDVRRLTVRFWLRPAAIEGTGRVSGLTVERTRLDETGVLTGTGELETVPAGMVLRSVGYQSVPLPGVPFDEGTATVPNSDGRVLGPGGEPLPGEYVAGWLKRGPTGVIGTNKSDAAGSVRSLLADLADGAGERRAPAAPGGSGRPPLEGLLAARGVAPVSYADWLRVEQAEAALGLELGRGARVKLPGREALESICRPPGP
jgi:ferredoxin--NADP+ reductase